MGPMASMAGRPNLGHNAMNWKTFITLAMSTVLPGIHLAVSCQDNENEPNSISCEIPPNSNRYCELWATMDSVHQGIGGELSILHVGGSHVQAGWIGHFMREQLALWSPQAIWSKGLMLPYRLAKTNTPTHFRTEMSGSWQGSRCTRKTWDEINSDVGSGTGIQVRTGSPASTLQHVAFLPDSSKFSANTFDIWTNARPSEISFYNAGSDANMTPLIDQSGWRIVLSTPVDTFRLSLQSAANRSIPIAYEGAYSQISTAAPRMTYNEWGHNGLHIRDMRKCVGLQKLVKRMQPDLVIIGIGLNDAIDKHGFDIGQFSADYSVLMRQLEKRLPNAAFLLLSNTHVHPTNETIAKHSNEIKAFLRAHAESTGCGFFDLGAAIGGNESTADWMTNDWMKSDGIHFHSSGYQRIAGLLYDAIHQAFQHHFSCKNPTDK